VIRYLQECTVGQCVNAGAGNNDHCA
jgi:hypothetical protein